MPSPFPGMDPYLEGHLRTDVHQALAYGIRQQLAPRIRPRYLTRLAVTNYVDYASSLAEVVDPVVSEAIDVPAPVFQIRAVSVEVYDAAENRLVTAIEILSPVNKRQPDLKKL